MPIVLVFKELEGIRGGIVDGLETCVFWGGDVPIVLVFRELGGSRGGAMEARWEK